MCSVRALSVLGRMPSASAAIDEMWLWNAVRSGITEPTTRPSRSFGFTRGHGVEARLAGLPDQVAIASPCARRTSTRPRRPARPSSWHLSPQPPRAPARGLCSSAIAERGLAVVGARIAAAPWASSALISATSPSNGRDVQRRVAAGGPRVDVGAAREQRRDDPQRSRARPARRAAPCSPRGCPTARARRRRPRAARPPRRRGRSARPGASAGQPSGLRPLSDAGSARGERRARARRRRARPPRTASASAARRAARSPAGLGRRGRRRRRVRHLGTST